MLVKRDLKVPIDQIPRCFNIITAGKICGVDRRVIASWIKNKGLPCERPNYHVAHIYKDEFLQWLQANEK